MVETEQEQNSAGLFEYAIVKSEGFWYAYRRRVKTVGWRLIPDDCCFYTKWGAKRACYKDTRPKKAREEYLGIL